MDNCPVCGEEVIKGFDTCFACGHSLDQEKTFKNDDISIQQNNQANILFLMVALVFPVVGLMVALLLMPTNEKLARQMLLFVFIAIVFYAMLIFFFAAFIAL